MLVNCGELTSRLLVIPLNHRWPTREATILSMKASEHQGQIAPTQSDSHREVSRLRERLARRELEKSSILASIASPYPTAVQIRGAMSRYSDLEAEIQSIIDQIRTISMEVPQQLRSELMTLPHHRVNSDGTIDSICFRCFATIASCRREEDLRAAEPTHVCDPEALRRFDHQEGRSLGPISNAIISG